MSTETENSVERLEIVDGYEVISAEVAFFLATVLGEPLYYLTLTADSAAPYAPTMVREVGRAWVDNNRSVEIYRFNEMGGEHVVAGTTFRFNGVYWLRKKS